ncbi:MAG: hypothetical protein ACPG77_06615, partial [Nannocystaceae bacterium]
GRHFANQTSVAGRATLNMDRTPSMDRHFTNRTSTAARHFAPDISIVGRHEINRTSSVPDGQPLDLHNLRLRQIPSFPNGQLRVTPKRHPMVLPTDHPANEEHHLSRFR